MGDLTVSSISRERKWPNSSVKEYQRKDKAQIKLKSISEATKSIRSAISKQVNIKSLHQSQRKQQRPFKAHQITINAC